MTALVATAWTSAGDTSPLHSPATSPVPIEERIAAIASAGYCGMGLIADDLLAIADTIGLHRLRELIDEAGLRHIEIELLERWWIPRGHPGHSYDVRDQLLAAADILRPSFIKIGSDAGPAAVDLQGFVPALRDLADAAAAHDTRLAIEPMPFSLIASVPMAAELVATTGRPNVGVLVDAWHVFRAGTSLDQLHTALPPEAIFGVELDDAAEETVGTLFEDTVQRRKLCGAGSFDLSGLIALLRDKGFDGPWGVEILADWFRVLPVDEALQLAANTARAALL